MIPPNKGSNLSQDSSLNMKTWENCYLLGYKGPNKIYEAVPKRAQTLIYMVEVSDPKDEKVKCGSPYNFAMLNSPETGHLGKTLISPNW